MTTATLQSQFPWIRQVVQRLREEASVKPESLSSLERATRLTRLRKLAHLLDESIRIPVINYRVGLDGVLGLVPFAGDAVGVLLSLYIVREAARLGVDRKTITKMLVNVGVDFLGGTVPIVGDLFDVAYKANKKNRVLLDAHFARNNAVRDKNV